jgi:glycosyltransferase involved in cell wall biosynthesis
MELLDDGGEGTQIVRDVIRLERELCKFAHLVLTCSHEDRVSFNRLYGIPFEKMRVFPNGTFTNRVTPATPEQKAFARKALNLGPSPVVFFIGSNYIPNGEAAAFIADSLAPVLPDMLLVIAGGVCESLAGRPLPFNLRLLGLLDEDARQMWLHASDIAINPMFGGSGTNVKMLDYMAAGLPIVTTPVGARGLETSDRAFVQSAPGEFAHRLNELSRNPTECRKLHSVARSEVLASYSWNRVSSRLGMLLNRHARRRLAHRPFFSVVVPTYERPSSLTKLVERMLDQSCQDFELIIVDQSAQLWPDRDKRWPIELRYVHSDVRGAVRARNTGADLSCGTIIAFVDDDCEPCRDWLTAARDEFADDGIVGLEGLVESDCLKDPSWRPVTNRGFEGIAFLTANLLIRAEIFHRINGFDVAFDNPHFREDTDLAWRALEYGRIPFSSAAKVFHPAQPRSLERESLSHRASFFEKDALLLRKHPDKYRELMRREAHCVSNPLFWPHFLAGTERYQVDLPEDILAKVPKPLRKSLKSAAIRRPTASR